MKQRAEHDKAKCACGVFGIYNHPNAAFLTYYGLHSLQHRGQESAGICSAFYPDKNDHDHKKFRVHKAFGLVNEVFKDEEILEKYLEGDSAIGHNRYSTAGSAIKRANIQPFYVNYKNGNLALAHNGNLTNTRALRKELKDDGVLFQTSTDTELILHLVSRSKQATLIEQLRDALRQVRGAYSLALLTDNALIGVRDPSGFRPLAIGKVDNSYVIASETCALDIINAEFIREVRNNEIVVIDDETVRTGKIKSYFIDDGAPPQHQCIFEYVYFARPDSKIYSENVDKVRRRLGVALAQEAPLSDGDEDVVVINVPDSSNTATLGYAMENNRLGNKSRYEIGLIRNHYVGRTFIQPGQDRREHKVKMKFNVVRGALKGKKVVVVDDSIVRGTTLEALVRLIKTAEPREIHIRITSPPITHPCRYGMDFPTREELIANQCNMDVEKIRERLGVDSLAYLSVNKLLDSAPHENGEGYCTACFTGKYPVKIEVDSTKLENED
ncbi:MAG TPA: amidophosphoribosyltransferase [Candidatus Kapabacteria bacterium]|nr:amidophosphoribosyltransferase [Candidatus Kapabacteria bacterium]